MNTRILLALPTVLLVLAAPGRAEPVEEFISTDEARPAMDEMKRLSEDVRIGKRRREDVQAELARKANDPKAPARDRAIAQFIYGHFLVSLGKKDEAVAAWKAALQLFPQFPDAQLALGKVALAFNDLSVAKKHAHAALKINPRHFHAFVFMAQIALAQNNLPNALLWFQKALAQDPTNETALQGAAMTYVRSYKDAASADRKQEFSQKARNLVDAWVSMEPNSALPRVIQARVYQMVDRPREAIEKLERLLAEVTGLRPEERMVCLDLLYQMRAETGDIEGAKAALKRLIKIPELPAPHQERYSKQLADLEEVGLKAFIQWQVEEVIKVVSNRGESPTVRRDAMRRLHQLLDEPRLRDDPELAPVVDQAWRACVRTLSPPTPPELAVDMLSFFRSNVRDRRIIRIVVHFLTPEGSEDRNTEAVRVEAVRTVAELGGKAAVPTLLYSLMSDDSLRVARAADQALCAILDRRSMIAVGAGPVTLDEQRQLRLGWQEWKHSATGAVRLQESLKELHDLTAKDARFNRKNVVNPLANHVTVEVLLDNDVEFDAWKAGYVFLRDFMGRDFLPPEHREKAIEPAVRPLLYEEIKKWWMGAPGTQVQKDEKEEKDDKDDRDDGEEKNQAPSDAMRKAEDSPKPKSGK